MNLKKSKYFNANFYRETNILNTVIKGDDFVSVKHDNVNVEAIAEEKEEVKGEVKDRNDIIHEGGSDEEYEEQKINKGYTKDVKVENNKVFVKLNGVKLTNTITWSQQWNGHTNVRSKSIGGNLFTYFLRQLLSKLCYTLKMRRWIMIKSKAIMKR